jgi:hypothetical protein
MKYGFEASCHCEKRSDEAIQLCCARKKLDCFASLAMTVIETERMTKISGEMRLAAFARARTAPDCALPDAWRG